VPSEQDFVVIRRKDVGFLSPDILNFNNDLHAYFLGNLEQEDILPCVCVCVCVCVCFNIFK
jgi:hypothetical protein